MVQKPDPFPHAQQLFNKDPARNHQKPDQYSAHQSQREHDARTKKQQEDKDRIYPGDGVAPFKQILTDLKNMKGPKILSLELFNREYWAQDALQVAKTGLEKMRKVVAEIA